MCQQTDILATGPQNIQSKLYDEAPHLPIFIKIFKLIYYANMTVREREVIT